MNYRSLVELNEGARQVAKQVPRDVDLVVGIPRSGLLAANLLCLHLDRAMTDVEGLCEGRVMATGHRYDGAVTDLSSVDRVLVIDDSVDTGRQLTETRERLAEHDFPFDIEYAAVFIAENGYQHVDYWGEVVSKPRVFEWNLMHHPMLQVSCVDIDGVLCRDPTPEENDGGPRYREFIRDVEPSVVPSERIGWLVTSRLEKYREETEAWLDRHGIEYDELVMLDMDDPEERRENDVHGQFKASVYDSTDAELFIESSPKQAAEIRDRTNRPVFSYRSNEMVKPGAVANAYEHATNYVDRLRRNPVAFTRLAGTYVASQLYHRTRLAAQRVTGDDGTER
jgi:orotate phosphoribosyltransferase